MAVFYLFQSSRIPLQLNRQGILYSWISTFIYKENKLFSLSLKKVLAVFKGCDISIADMNVITKHEQTKFEYIIRLDDWLITVGVVYANDKKHARQLVYQKYLKQGYKSITATIQESE